MKNTFLILLVSAFFAGCATGGDVPEWWNPSGTYSKTPPDEVLELKRDPKTPVVLEREAKTVTVTVEKPSYEDTFTPIVTEKVEITDLPAPSVLSE